MSISAAVRQGEVAIEFSEGIGRKAAEGKLTIGQLLGGPSVFGDLAKADAFDSYAWHQVTSHGIPMKAIWSLQEGCFPHTSEGFFNLIGMSLRTAQRKKSTASPRTTSDIAESASRLHLSSSTCQRTAVSLPS